MGEQGILRSHPIRAVLEPVGRGSDAQVRVPGRRADLPAGKAGEIRGVPVDGQLGLNVGSPRSSNVPSTIWVLLQIHRLVPTAST